MISSPHQAITAVADRLSPVGCETIEPALGRVLAAAITADRDSPAADVSAMDGYAVRIDDLRSGGETPVAGEVQPGQSPSPLPPRASLRIFTGAVIPPGTEVVVRREDTVESPTVVRWTAAAERLAAGANIRRQGENGRAGSLVIAPGTELTAASIAAAANFGIAQVATYRQVAVSVVVTGNELLAVSDTPAPWQLRDSNGPTVTAMLAGYPWLRVSGQVRCTDDATAMQTMLQIALAESDAVIITGGVSKGDYDLVPAVIEAVGGEIVFHRLAIRPGHPVLAAVTAAGKLILGLPGNPVSTACCLRRIGLPLLTRLSGRTDWRADPAPVTVADADDRSLPMHWMRLVRRTDRRDPNGFPIVESVASKGSGDLVALGTSDGFIEQPPDESGAGPWDFYRWAMA